MAVNLFLVAVVLVALRQVLVFLLPLVFLIQLLLVREGPQGLRLLELTAGIQFLVMRQMLLLLQEVVVAHIGIVADHSPALGQMAAVGVVVLVVSPEALVHRDKGTTAVTVNPQAAVVAVEQVK